MLKRLKKIALLFVSILVLFSGMSCSSGDDNDGNTNTENESNNNNNNNNNNAGNNNNADNNDGENNTDELPESVGTNPFAGKTFIVGEYEDIEYRFTENKVTVVEVYDGIEEVYATFNYTYDIEKQLLYMEVDVNSVYGSMDEAIEYMISVGVEESDTDLLMVSAQAIELSKYEIDGNKLRLADAYDPNDLRTIDGANDDVDYYYGNIYFDIYDSENISYSAFIKYDGNNFSGSIYLYEYNEEEDLESYTKKGEIKGTYSIDSENDTFTLTVTECPAEIDIKGTHVLDIYC